MLLDYALKIFDCVENLFDEIGEFSRSLIIQVEEELELIEEIKQTLNNEIKERENYLNELQEEIRFCNNEILSLNRDLVTCEKRVTNFAKKGILDSQDLKPNCMNLQDFDQDRETRQVLRNYWTEPELMNQRRIHAQAIRNQAKKIRHQSAEIRRNIQYFKKSCFFSHNDKSSLTQFEQS